MLRGCHRALSEHRIRMIQLEWNMGSITAVGTDRRPIAELLAMYSIRSLPARIVPAHWCRSPTRPTGPMSSPARPRLPGGVSGGS